MNYQNTFILVADDCPAKSGSVPTIKAGKVKPIHAIQYDLMTAQPYKFTQEDVLFAVFAQRNKISVTDVQAREAFLSKSQPCLRTSALGKKYGWGIHFNQEGKAALFSKGSSEYNAFENDKQIKVIKAMRNKRA